MCKCDKNVIYKRDYNNVLLISKHEVIMRGASYDNYS